MSSVPAGKRLWKCPECGSEVQLSVTQLDPLACDACLAKMKSKGSPSVAGPIADGAAGPLAIWSALPEVVKLGAAVVSLIAGLVIGYIAGQVTATSTRPEPKTHSSSHSRERAATDEDLPEYDPVTPAPGPGYKWMPGRKHKDGTRGDGYWAKDPHYKGDESSKKKLK